MGKVLGNKGLTESGAKTLLKAKDTALTWLESQGSFKKGLIHADALRENVMGTPDALWLIDFDDAGRGYHLYDLGVALSQQWDASDLAEITRALIDGYTAGTDDDTITENNVLRFMALRTFASAGWADTRTPLQSAGRQKHINRAVACAEKYFLS